MFAPACQDNEVPTHTGTEKGSDSLVDFNRYPAAQVINTLQFELSQILRSELVNDFIVLLLASKQLVDDTELEPIKLNSRLVYSTEAKRITALLEIFKQE